MISLSCPILLATGQSRHCPPARQRPGQPIPQQTRYADLALSPPAPNLAATVLHDGRRRGGPPQEFVWEARGRRRASGKSNESRVPAGPPSVAGSEPRPLRAGPRTPTSRRDSEALLSLLFSAWPAGPRPIAAVIRVREPCGAVPFGLGARGGRQRPARRRRRRRHRGGVGGALLQPYQPARCARWSRRCCRRRRRRRRTCCCCHRRRSGCSWIACSAM